MKCVCEELNIVFCFIFCRYRESVGLVGLGIGANVGVSAVAGIGGLSNGAKRNAKADQLRLVPRHNLNKETESNEDTEPRLWHIHCVALNLR